MITPAVKPAALSGVIDGEPLIITSCLIRFHFRLEVLPFYSTESIIRTVIPAAAPDTIVFITSRAKASP